MTRYLIYIMVLLPLNALGSQLVMNDFGYGYPINVAESGGVYSFTIPAEAYQKVRHADLRDLRIYDKNGNQVPHSIRSLTKQKAVGQIVEINFFPLYQKEEFTGKGDLSLSVRRDVTGTVIDINDPGGELKAVEHHPIAYLFDLKEDFRPLSAMELQWQTSERESAILASLEHSRDLQHWEKLSSTTALVDIDYQENRIVQRTITMNRKPYRYLRLDWSSDSPELLLEKATLHPEKPQSTMELQWVEIGGTIEKEEGDLTLQFSSPYQLPVSRAQLQFQQSNSIILGRLQSSGGDGDWRTRCETLFYNLDLGGKQLRNEMCSFRTTTDRNYRLLIRQDGADVHNDNRVTLQLGWQSGELYFLARGTPPYVLAFGSGKLEQQESRIQNDMLLKVMNKKELDKFVKEAVLGEQFELGGEKALQPPAVPLPWKTILLWGVLILGVVVMAFMAVNLVQEFKKGQKKEQ